MFVYIDLRLLYMYLFTFLIQFVAEKMQMQLQFGMQPYDPWLIVSILFQYVWLVKIIYF